MDDTSWSDLNDFEMSDFCNYKISNLIVNERKLNNGRSGTRGRGRGRALGGGRGLGCCRYHSLTPIRDRVRNRNRMYTFSFVKV